MKDIYSTLFRTIVLIAVLTFAGLVTNCSPYEGSNDWTTTSTTISTNIGNFACIIDRGKITITGLSPEGQSVCMLDIPSTLGDYPVVEIGMAAFHSHTILTNVTIGDGITNIGSTAFYGCDGLTNVTMPNSVITLGNSAFSHCYYLKKVKLSTNLTAILAYTFYSCGFLNNIIIPASVNSIEDFAFSGCNGLTNATVMSVVPPTAGDYLFSSYAPLVTIYVPAGSVEAYKSAPGWSKYSNVIVSQ